MRFPSFITLCALACACGGKSADTDARAGAEPPPAPSVDPFASTTPNYYVHYPSIFDGRRDRVSVEATFIPDGAPVGSYGAALPEGARMTVNGVDLTWMWVSEASQANAASIPVADDDQYTFELTHAGRSWKTKLHVAAAEIQTPVAGGSATTPLVVTWNRDVAKEEAQISLSACDGKVSVGPSALSTRSATFDVDLAGAASCNAGVHLYAAETVPLELGAPFRPGRGDSFLEAGEVLFTITK